LLFLGSANGAVLGFLVLNFLVVFILSAAWIAYRGPRLPLLFLLVHCLCAGLFFFGCPWWLVVLVGLAALALPAWLLQRRGVAWVGPLAYYELIRLARQGRVTLLRCAYGLALLAGLALAYLDRFGRTDWRAALFAERLLPPNALAELGVVFFRALFLVQSIAVVVLTPVYVSAALPAERERHTLDLLRTTHLRAHEIVLGKLVARLAHTGGILLTGLPVLFLILWWGGVDADLVLACAAATVWTALSVGGVSLLCSVNARSQTAALATSYGVLAAALTFLTAASSIVSPFTFLRESPIGPEISLRDRVLAFAVFHGTMAWACVVLSVLYFRRQGAESARPARGSFAEALSLLFARRRGVLGGLLSLPPVGDRPLLWKEEHFPAARAAGSLPGTALLFVSALTVLVTASCLVVGIGGRELLDLGLFPALRFLIGLHVGWLCLRAGFHAAGCVSREREGRTWESLLALPVERDDILRAKAWGSAERVSLSALVLLVEVVALVLFLVLHPVGALLLGLAATAHLAFFVCLGVWLSLACRSTLRATMWMAVAVLVLFAGPWVVTGFSRTLGSVENPGVAVALEAGVSPPGTWWTLTLSWRDFAAVYEPGGSAHADRREAAIFGAVAYAAAALWLWRQARRKLVSDPV
jgi:ABC-type transport system involved in multi-copper enzyme maturation permease subunit